MPVRVFARLLAGVILVLAIDIRAQQPQQTPESLILENLAARLVEASDAAGREALLSEHAGLVGAPLAQALVNVGRDARNKGQIERVRRAYEATIEVAIRANASAAARACAEQPRAPRL